MEEVKDDKVGELICGYDPVRRAWVIGPRTEDGTIDMNRVLGAHGTPEAAEEGLKRLKARGSHG